ncbi:hypothetical protein, partial [Micromonospora sp. MP36]|uniref:hypothetical protein n=1 Tax=Micromonospora sp. MP36 TaxID=2604468 RepID=UPI001CA35092
SSAQASVADPDLETELDELGVFRMNTPTLDERWEPQGDADSVESDLLAGVDSPTFDMDWESEGGAGPVDPSDLLAGVDSPTFDMDWEPQGGAGPVGPSDLLAGEDPLASVADFDWLADADTDEALRLLAAWDQVESELDLAPLPENPAPIGPDRGPGGAPAVGGSSGARQDWKRTVASAVAQLSAVERRGGVDGTRDDAAEFVRWTSEVLGVDLAGHTPKANDLYNAVVRRFGRQLEDAGVHRSSAGLRAWVARQLAADLRLGDASEFRKLLPYPEVMSEQRREDLHRQWLNKITHDLTGDYDIAHVVLPIIASRLPLSMRIHHPYGAPDDIGPEPDADAIPYPVVFHNGAYHLGQLPDPADGRLAEGFPWTVISDDEKQRLDQLFDEARDLLQARIKAAEENPVPTNAGHLPILQETFQRKLAAIRKQPNFPYSKKARELAEHLDYLRRLARDSKWDSGNRRNLDDQFTLLLPVSQYRRRRPTYLRTWLGGKFVILANIDRMAISGDMIAVHFGTADGVGAGIVVIEYTAPDGTKSEAHQEISRRFTGVELAELREKAPDKVWHVDRPRLLGDFYSRTTPVQEGGRLGVRLGRAEGRRQALPGRILNVPVIGGLPPVVVNELKEVRLLLGYAEDGGRPTAVVEAPARTNVTELPLYLEISRPTMTRYDIKRLRKRALWEPAARWDLSEEMSFDVILQEGTWTPGPLSIAVGGADPAKTLDGAEVDLSPGTLVTLWVGKWQEPGSVGADVVGTIPAVVKAPLVDTSGHVYRLVDTGVDNKDFDDLKREIIEALAVSRQAGVLTDPGSDWSQTVKSAIRQLSAVGKPDEQNFVRWTRDVFGIDLAGHTPKANDLYNAVVRRFGRQLEDAGVHRSSAGLRAWVARQLAADLRLGDASEFRKLLPYPEVMSEQRREDLHRQWLNKITHDLTGDYDIAHVVLPIIASRLPLSMRIHHPYGAPDDIGPEPDADAIPYPVVFHNGAYHLGQLPDPADAERAGRLAEGPERTSISDDEQRRLDQLFDEARDLLQARIKAAEENPHPTNAKHWPILQEVFQRKLAVIRKQPDFPYRKKARELVEHRRYLDSLGVDSLWEEKKPDLRGQFTLDIFAVGVRSGRSSQLRVRLGGIDRVLLNVDQLVMHGDSVAFHFGALGEERIGIAEFRYTDAADGTDRIIYRRGEHKLGERDLAELRRKAAGRVWERRHQPLSSDYYQVTLPFRARGRVAGLFGDPKAKTSDRLLTVPPRPVVGGLPPVLPAELDGRLLLGYARDGGRPTAVLVAQAEKNVRGLPLYLEPRKPALVVDDIKRRRKEALWEPTDRWDLSGKMPFDVVLQEGTWTPGPLSIAVGGPDPAKTLDGAEVDLSPGTLVTLWVGKWPEPVGADVAGTIPAVVKAPLVDKSGHVYRLVDTGVDNKDFDNLKRKITEALTVSGQAGVLTGPGSGGAPAVGGSGGARQAGVRTGQGSGGAPAVGGSGGARQGWKRTVASAIGQLSAVGKRDEQNFVRWTRDVFGIDLAKGGPKPNFYDSVTRTFSQQLADLKLDRIPNGLHGWAASSLAAELRLGDASEFRELFPYPEVMSEQRREDLHRNWIDKVANHQNGDYDVAPVVVRILARKLSQLRIYQPFGAPDDIGPESDAGADPYPVVFYDGAFYLGQLPADAERAGRLAEGPERTSISDDEKQRLDGLFDQALGLLQEQINEAEQDPRPANRHWPALREAFQRKLAVIRQRPESPQRQADILTEHRRYLYYILRASGWKDESRGPQTGRFTHYPTVRAQYKQNILLMMEVGGKSLRLPNFNPISILGDRIAVDFWMDGEEGLAEARFPYTAPDGTESFMYQEFATRPTAADLTKLMERAAEARWSKVESAIGQLSAGETRSELAAFEQWAHSVFHIDRAEGDAGPLDVFYGTVLKTHGDLLAQAGVTTVAELGVLVARHLDVDLRRGEQSMFRAFLPYPENMSEQRRETLHRHLLNKLVHRQPGYPDVVHVVPHIVAWGLGLPMEIHHPFGAPHVIGPPSDDGAKPQPVVLLNGAYYLGQPRDPHDARIVEGFPSPTALTELRRLDVVFDEAFDLLKTEVDAAEQNTTNRHWSLLRDTFDRNLAAVRQRPSSPRRHIEVLEEHRRYVDALREDSKWEDENRWNLQDPFTVPVPVEDIGGRPYLQFRVGDNDVFLEYVGRVAVAGDRVAVVVGKVDGEGVGIAIARIPYTAPDGTERFVYQEFARRFTDSELAELRSMAAGPVWETADRWKFGNLYHITAPVSESGIFNITFGGQRVTIPPVEVADGLPPVIAAELKEGRFRLGYGMDGLPLAVLEAPAGRNGTGAPLYLELSSPAPTAYDIEWLRTLALWESIEPPPLLDEVSIDLVMQEDKRTPDPLPLALGGDNSGKTLDGREVDLSPGTEVTLRVGRFFRLEEPNVVTSVFAAVKAPLADRSGYAHRLIDTNMSNEWFDEFKKQREMTDSGKRRAGPEGSAGPVEKRPRTGDGVP